MSILLTETRQMLNQLNRPRRVMLRAKAIYIYYIYIYIDQELREITKVFTLPHCSAGCLNTDEQENVIIVIKLCTMKSDIMLEYRHSDRCTRVISMSEND